jgi:hypothetical protein
VIVFRAGTPVGKLQQKEHGEPENDGSKKAAKENSQPQAMNGVHFSTPSSSIMDPKMSMHLDA